MDWDWKDLGWDLVEWEEKDDSSLAGVVSSSGLPGQESGGLMVDLKLGRISDTGQRSVDASKDLRASPMASSPSGSSKKNRALSGTQNVSCLVDGCKSDLNMCREYHRRHRVCERHSKTPVVIVGGKEQRFCQQCSRFHSLGEFDEVKRSCRKRLDGHNMRRRKSQPESLYLSEKFLSDYKGPRILQFSSPQIYATTALKSARPAIPRSEAETMIYNSHWRFPNTGGQSPPNSFAFIYNEENKMLSFLRENGPKVGNQAASEASVYQPIPNSIASTESGRDNYNTLSSGLTQSIDLGCALYLLSSHPAQTSAMGLSHRVPSSVSNPIQSLDSGQQPLGLAQYSCSLIPEATESNILCNGMFPGSFDALLES